MNRRVLDDLLASRSHLSVLRAVLSDIDPATGRQIAKAAGVSPQAAHEALGTLEEMGVVTWRPVGKAQLYSVNEESLLVKEILRPLFKGETDLEAKMISSLQTLGKGLAVSTILFGSEARGEGRSASDLDVLWVVNGERALKQLKERLAEEADDFEREFYRRLSPLVMTKEEVAKGEQARNPLMLSILKDGRPL